LRCEEVYALRWLRERVSPSLSALGAAVKEYWATEQQLPTFASLSRLNATSQLMPLYDGPGILAASLPHHSGFFALNCVIKIWLASKDHWLVTLISTVWAIMYLNFPQIFVSSLSYDFGRNCVCGNECRTDIFILA
jgi:hypothetical protein